MKYWPKLLRSYCLEAISNSDTGTEKVDRDTALAFLTRVAGQGQTDDSEQVYKLVEHQSETGASFELVSTKDRSPVLIHFNRVTKR